MSNLAVKKEIEFEPKQRLAIAAKDVDTLILGGARGGGKSFALAAKMSSEIQEIYSERQVKAKDINIEGFRVIRREGVNYYFKYLIDYPDYRGVIVRRTEPALMSQTHTECRKVYPLLGGVWSNKKWTFPGGAEIWYRPCEREKDLEWFQGQNFHRLGIEELTQFDQGQVEEMEACCRSSHEVLIPMKVYTTNPGKRGHRWVKKKYIDNCKPVADGDEIEVPEFGIKYQPLKPGKKYKHPETGEVYWFIPSLVFDNKYLAERDKKYIRNLMGKNHILRQMWLYGNWDVFAGQFFSMWDEAIHIRSEMDFFDANNYDELVRKRRDFDWSDWSLYLSNDYGFAETSAWACGMYAVNLETRDIVKVFEIVESGLTIKQQCWRTKELLWDRFRLKPDDFELHVADPKSYWQRQDKGEDFWDFARAYQEEGINLTKGLNDREQGAMACLEALRVREDGTAMLTFLDCCKEATDSIPNLPADPNNLNDVDTTAFDHPYDEMRYFLMVLRSDLAEPEEKRGERPGMENWRERMKKVGQGGNEVRNWKVA